jgi:hypothetical protein
MRIKYAAPMIALLITINAQAAFLFECGEYKLRGIFYKERLNKNLLPKSQKESASPGNYLLVFFKGGLGEIVREVKLPDGQEHQLPKWLEPNHGHPAEVIIKVKTAGGASMEYDLQSIGPALPGKDGMPTKGEVKKISSLPCQTPNQVPAAVRP